MENLGAWLDSSHIIWNLPYDERHMNIDKPLALPEGSVRAILALMLVAAFIFVDNENISDATLIVLGFYFGSRQKGEE